MRIFLHLSALLLLAINSTKFKIPTAPSGDSQASAFIINGNSAPSGIGTPVTTSGQCLNAYLLLPDGQRICGQNSGQHCNYISPSVQNLAKNSPFSVYIDINGECIDLAIFIGLFPTSNNFGFAADSDSAGERQLQWSIKISQYTCEFNNLPPQGCTQWYFGFLSGVVTSFNYDGGLHLASQLQNICVRSAPFSRNFSAMYNPTST